MEVHPWVWVFRAGYTKDRGAILTADPDWIELSKAGEQLSPNGGLWISPCTKEAREFLADLFSELVSTYDVDGLHLDYIRYEDQTSAPYGYSPVSRSNFLRQYGVDPSTFRRAIVPSIRMAEVPREAGQHVHADDRAADAEPQAEREDLGCGRSDPGSMPVLDLLQNWPNWVDNSGSILWLRWRITATMRTSAGWSSGKWRTPRAKVCLFPGGAVCI